MIGLHFTQESNKHVEHVKPSLIKMDFLGGYLPSLSINYVGMSKDIWKKATTTVLYKDENFL